MNKLLAVAALAALGLAACTQLRVPNDQELATLVSVQNASPDDADAPLDPRVIDCLRAWSGDAELLKGLAVRFAGEDGKKACRTTLDGRIADTARNPEKFTFEEISAPKVVRRAVEMYEARRVATMSDPARRQIPAALTKPATGPTKFATPDPTVDLGLAGTRLLEAEALCQQAKQAATEPNAGSSLKRFAGFCTAPLRKLRTTLETSAKRGRASEQLEAMADSADNISKVAREVLSEPR